MKTKNGNVFVVPFFGRRFVFSFHEETKNLEFVVVRVVQDKKQTPQNLQRGFTLVELAISITIIGLLIGGVLKGQEMVKNARITATVAQVQAIEAAATTFRDAYNGMPGDIVNAGTRIPNCTNYCNLAPGVTAGDGIVGISDWSTRATILNGVTYVGFLPLHVMVGGKPVNGNNVALAEPVLFFSELVAANLLTGVTTSPISGTNNAVNYTFGNELPAAKITGGFVVGYSDGTPIAGVGGSMSGHVLALLSNPTTQAGTTPPLTASQAAQLDRKMDDGVAYSGVVQAIGSSQRVTGVGTINTFTQGCAAKSFNINYSEAASQLQCGLFFQIQS